MFQTQRTTKKERSHGKHESDLHLHSGQRLQAAICGQCAAHQLRHKLLGETQFKLDEAERLSTMLGLTMAERDACFFDAENRFSRSATLELPKRGKRQ